MVHLEELSELQETLSAEQLVRLLIPAADGKRVCLTSSFQAEDMAVLHMLRSALPDVSVIFLDTGYHFPETYEYRDRMTREWDLNLVNALPEKTVAEQEAQHGLLYIVEPAKCCGFRKVEPLAKSLEPFDIWFTGLRREQSPTRRNLKKIERHQLPSGKELLKVSILADWDWQRVWNYTTDNAIPYLSLYDQGYRSIGCQPCTALPDDPNNPRSGRWGGKKLECGIHTFSEAKPLSDTDQQ